MGYDWMISRRRLCRMALAGAALAPAACGGAAFNLTDGLPPDVGLSDLRLGEAGVFEQTLLLGLRFSNPNDYRVDVEHVLYELELNGTAFGRGVYGEDFRLAANEDTIVEVPLRVPTGDLLNRLTSISNQRGVGYRLSGRARLIGGGLDQVPFQQEGRIDLPSFGASQS
ncbi:MAG: LEA type 2 family protein [Geminicoccaceae bacterium]